MNVSAAGVDDAERLVRDVDFPAMQGGPLYRAMFPKQHMTKDEQERIIQWYCDGLQEAIHCNNERFLQICDDDGFPLAFCGWTFETSDLTAQNEVLARKSIQSKLPSTLDMPSWSSISSDLRTERQLRLRGLSRYCRKTCEKVCSKTEYLTRRVGITFMSVSLNHQRKGMGSTMLKSALCEIDKLGIHTFVMSSPAGVALYKKFGFDILGKVETKTGAFTSMMRSPPP